jgi:RNA recognition motif-containing protein
MEEEFNQNNFRELFVGNLDPNVDEDTLYKIFSVFGDIEFIKLYHESLTNKFEISNLSLKENKIKCSAKVVFFNSIDAKTAVNLTNETLLNGLKIKVYLENRLTNSNEIIKFRVKNDKSNSNVAYNQNELTTEAEFKIEIPKNREVKYRIDSLAKYISEVRNYSYYLE